MSNDFIGKLKRLRERNDLKQSSIAQCLGVSRDVYGRYERGDRIPSIDFIVAVCRYYNVSSDYLLGLSDQMQPSPDTHGADSRIEFIGNFVREGVPRGPLDDLDDDLRQKAEGYIEALHEIQRERSRQVAASSRSTISGA